MAFHGNGWLPETTNNKPLPVIETFLPSIFFSTLFFIGLYDLGMSLFDRYDKGAYLFLPSYMMRIHGARQQREAVKRTPRKQLAPVFEVRL